MVIDRRLQTGTAGFVLSCRVREKMAAGDYGGTPSAGALLSRALDFDFLAFFRLGARNFRQGYL
jgi:hypothetical protein